MIFNKMTHSDFDKTILIVTYFIFAIGLAAIWSATQAKELPFLEGYVWRQINWMVLGTIILLLIIMIPYNALIDISYILYAINIILLMLVLVLGHVRLGAQRWFSIGAFTFQPSEFMKLSLILALANYIGSKKGDMKEVKNLITPLVLLGIPFILVLLQPDLGTAVILLPILISLLLVSGTDLKLVAGLVILGIMAVPFFWHFMHDYQRQRLVVFLNPNIDPLGAGYTIIQSKIAVGSGGLFGKGWLEGTQNQLNFLPERHTDFIFSVIGEEWGFLGALCLILLYLLIAKRGFRIAALTGDIHGKLVATGLSVMLALQVVINIGMTIGLMPVVGIPLPLVSYGGSSLIATLIAIGLLLNIGLRRLRF